MDGKAGGVGARTATPLGARLDGEVDAFLSSCCSSIAVSRDYGSWVLVIGAARYALLLAGGPISRLAAPSPPLYRARSWPRSRASRSPSPHPEWSTASPALFAVAAALLLLVESFGRNVLWLYRTGSGLRTRRAVRIAVTALRS